MTLLSDILDKIIKSLSSDIKKVYENFYDYTLDLLRHKNVNIDGSIIESEEKIALIVNSINSALNTTGIPITELSNQEKLKEAFQDSLTQGNLDFKALFDTVGKEFIDQHLFKIIFEYIIDLDRIKIENLDLFDLLPPHFKEKLEQFKKKNFLSSEEKNRLKSLLSTINSEFDPSNLQFKSKLNDKLDESGDIIQKLQEAKMSNIKALENLSVKLQSSKNQNFEIKRTTSENVLYYDYFGNFPSLNPEILQKINASSEILSEISSNLDLFMDLEVLFYFVSIMRILNTEIPFGPEKVRVILKNFIKGNVFSSGIYHMPNPLSNFYGLAILLELNMISKSEDDLIDLLDIEMFLESEINPFIASKLYLNYYTLLALNLLEKAGVSIMKKTPLLDSQLNLDLANINKKDLPRDLLYHLSTIKLIDKDYNFEEKYLTFDYAELISQNNLVNDNITDTARLILIFDILDLMNQQQEFIKVLYTAILTNYHGFNKELDNYWKTDPLVFKTELRMLFWLLLAFLRY